MSNFEWYGNIPKNWNVKKGKYLYKFIQTGKKDSGENNPGGKYPFFTCSKEVLTIDEYSFDREALLVAGNGIVGETKYYNGKFDAYQRVYVISDFTSEIFVPYLTLYMTNNFNIYLTWRMIGSVINFVKLDDIKNFDISYPVYQTQMKIANFLENKSRKIEDLIMNQQQQIEKIKEYKQSLISEVVTKGLDPNVEFKESGIEWIGKIPAHWKMVFLSSIFYEHKLKNANLVNTNLLSLSYGNIVNKDINTRDGLLPDSFEGYNIVSNNDIVLRLTDLQNDKKSLRVGLCTQEGIITSAYITIRAKVDLNSYYFHKLLHSYDINKVFYGMGSGVRQSMGFNEIRKIPLLLPPKNEMKIISERVQETVCKIDALITLKETKLEKLIDYKKSLIYEYVTGKKEVS